ncbi:MAG TPA: hypothetical protein O0X39_05975 [Methanocorpusculum sp.]|nr:hypothetical protein [Methanocorpusculum sp.]
MDEIAKTEARNYLSAAGFFVIAAGFLLSLMTKAGSATYIETSDAIRLVLGIGLLVIATLLIVLRKRDMISILFFMIGFLDLFYGFTPSVGLWRFILLGFLVLTALVTLTSKEKIKWLLFFIPAIWFVRCILQECFGYNAVVYAVFGVILIVILLYYAFACASERISLPGRSLLTADEQTDFKASGSVLGYMLFALAAGAFSLFYLFGNQEILSFETVTTLKLICCILLVYVSVLLFAVGKMRFTPVMFLLTALTLILSVYAEGLMVVGCGILFIVLGLFAVLRNESRVLPGIMYIIFGGTAFISVIAGGLLPSVPWLSVILNGIPALIAIYLAFAVYSQRKLPKF